MNKLNKHIPHLILTIILGVHVLIIKSIIFFPYPEFFIYPYLTNNGLKPYQQILDQHFPGLMFLPINFDNLGMNNELSARVWLIAIVLITHLFLFFISKNILKSSTKALLVNFLYLIWQPFFEGWVLWIDNFLPIFLLPAFYFLYKRKYFLTGLFIGLAITFKQTVIPLSCLLFFYILWSEKSLSSLTKYIFGLVPLGILMVLYYVWMGVFDDFWYWTVTFNLTVYATSGTQVPSNFGFITRVFVVYVTSLLTLFNNDKRLKITLIIFLLGSLVGAFDRANFVHFQPSLPFAVIGTVVGFYSIKKREILLILIGIYLTITVWWQNIFYKGHISDKVFFFDESTYFIANKIMDYTNPKDKIFVLGAAPHLYQMSQTLPSGDIFVFQFPWFLAVAEDKILDGIKKDTPEIIVVDRSVEIEGVKITDFASKIDTYILENYTRIDSVGSTDILNRKK